MMANSLLIALPYELSLDILIDWVGGREQELSSLDIAHTSLADRPDFLSLLSKITVVHDEPPGKPGRGSQLRKVSRAAWYPARIAWLLARSIALREEFLYTCELAGLVPVLSAGCFPNVEVLTLQEDMREPVEVFLAADFQLLLSACPNLRDLRCCYEVDDTDLEAINASQILLQRLHLQRLRLEEDFMLVQTIHTFAGTLVDLDLPNDTMLDKALFEAIGTCGSLTELRTPCTPETAHDLLAAYNILPNLTRLTLTEPEDGKLDDSIVRIATTCDRLKELHVQRCFFASPGVFLRILQSCPWLDALSTPGWGYNRHIEYVFLKEPELSAELSKLTVIGHSSSDEFLTDLLTYSPSDVTCLCMMLELNRLKNAHVQLITKRFGSQLLVLELRTAHLLAVLVSHCPLLLKLVIRNGGEDADDAVLQTIADKCKHIKHLSLSQFGKITDAGIDYFTRQLRQLVSIWLRNNNLLTGRCFAMVGSHCPNIESLFMIERSDSTQISTNDLVHSLTTFRHSIQLVVNHRHLPFLMDYFRTLGPGGNSWIRKVKYDDTGFRFNRK